MSRLAKLRWDPERFFADSRHSSVRRAGARVVPFLHRHPALLGLLEDPLERPLLDAVATNVRRIRERSRRGSHESVAVILAARNAESTLERAVDSLVRQIVRPREIIVVDDGSADATLRVAVSLAARHAVLRVLRSDLSHGVACARNVGLSVAQSALVTFQDADDWSHPARLALQLEALQRPGAIASTCLYRRVLPDGRPVTINGRRVRKLLPGVLFRRELVLDRIGYLRSLRTGEDSEFFARLRTLGDVATVERVLYYARFSSGSLLFRHADVIASSEDEVAVRQHADEAASLASALRSVEEAHGRGVPRVDFSAPPDYYVVTA